MTSARKQNCSSMRSHSSRWPAAPSGRNRRRLDSKPSLAFRQAAVYHGLVSEKARSKPKEAEESPASQVRAGANPRAQNGHPSHETRQWFKSLEFVLEYVLKNQGSEHAPYFVASLVDRLREAGVKV